MIQGHVDKPGSKPAGGRKPVEGASALAHFLTGPPPLRPSGKAQKAGEQPTHATASTCLPLLVHFVYNLNRPT